MKRILLPNQGIANSLLFLIAIISGLSVANLYYSQPLLNLIRSDFLISELQTNLISMLTQVGYAMGLLFIVPLADMVKLRTIVIINFSILLISLLLMGGARTLPILYFASLIIGVCSVIPQVFIPFVSQVSIPDKKSRNVGFIISGLLTGILASRVISGIIGGFLGWRSMYFIAAFMMLFSGVLVLLFFLISPLLIKEHIRV